MTQYIRNAGGLILKNTFFRERLGILMLAVTVFCKTIFTSLRGRMNHPRMKLFIGEETEKTVEGGKIQMGKTEKPPQAFMVFCWLL